MTKVRRPSFPQNAGLKKEGKSEEGGISDGDISSVEFSSDSESQKSTVPKIKALRQIVPKYKTLFDVFVEKYGIWKEAAIVKDTETEVSVHILYKNSSSSYKVAKKSTDLPPFLAKYGTKTFIGTNYSNIAIGSFVDVKSLTKWGIRKVIDVDLAQNRLKVNGKTFQDWIPLTPKHIMPLHHKTKASHPDHAYRLKFLNKNNVEPDPPRRKSARIAALPKRKRELSYREKLQKVGFDLKYMVGDGNCLFRAISHQVYGNSRHHAKIRSNCIDYLEANKDRFTPFVLSTEGGFEGYLKEKRKTGVWGDHIELQALCEIYSRSLYIFSESSVDKYVKLLKTMNEDSNYPNKPFVLSFLNEHYNSVIFLDTVEPEQIEEISLNDFFTISKLRKKLLTISVMKPPTLGSLKNDKEIAKKKMKPATKLFDKNDSTEPSCGFSDDEQSDIKKAIELSKNEMKKSKEALSKSSNSNPGNNSGNNQVSEEAELQKALEASLNSNKKPVISGSASEQVPTCSSEDPTMVDNSKTSHDNDIVLQQVLASTLSVDDGDNDFQLALAASLKQS